MLFVCVYRSETDAVGVGLIVHSNDEALGSPHDDNALGGVLLATALDVRNHDSAVIIFEFSTQKCVPLARDLKAALCNRIERV